MGKIVFILGGARSGKSAYALELAKKHKRVAFIATCQALDKEMASRIELHKKSRPKHWDTLEEPKDIKAIVGKVKDKYDCIIIDCLTLFISNLLLSGSSKAAIEKIINDLIPALKRINCMVIIVSNEVGMGIVPDNKLSRDFRDISGRVNQIVAREAGKVILTAAGLPLKIK